ncbi:hypothetical protein BU15DRAFT_7274, partial [Melanogaster broomeanus]
MTLPKDLPTLESLATKNWTRPDNVFCTDHSVEYVTHCYTDPALRGPLTDHVPILSVIELETPRVEYRETRNFREVDWQKFQCTIEEKMAMYPTAHPIITDREFQEVAHALTAAMTEAISLHVPMSRPNPHSKRWWNRDLSILRKGVQKAAALSYKTRALLDHPNHELHRIARNQY